MRNHFIAWLIMAVAIWFGVGILMRFLSGWHLALAAIILGVTASVFVPPLARKIGGRDGRP